MPIITKILGIILISPRDVDCFSLMKQLGYLTKFYPPKRGLNGRKNTILCQYCTPREINQVTLQNLIGYLRDSL